MIKVNLVAEVDDAEVAGVIAEDSSEENDKNGEKPSCLQCNQRND